MDDAINQAQRRIVTVRVMDAWLSFVPHAPATAQCFPATERVKPRPHPYTPRTPQDYAAHGTRRKVGPGFYSHRRYGADTETPDNVYRCDNHTNARQSERWRGRRYKQDQNDWRRRVVMPVHPSSGL